VNQRQVFISRHAFWKTLGRSHNNFNAASPGKQFLYKQATSRSTCPNHKYLYRFVRIHISNKPILHTENEPELKCAYRQQIILNPIIMLLPLHNNQLFQSSLSEVHWFLAEQWWQNIAPVVTIEATSQQAMDNIAQAMDERMGKLEGKMKRFSPKLNPETSAQEWLNKPGAPKAERPDQTGGTMAYDELINHLYPARLLATYFGNLTKTSCLNFAR
jgi:hypothetical protein